MSKNRKQWTIQSQFEYLGYEIGYLEYNPEDWKYGIKEEDNFRILAKNDTATTLPCICSSVYPADFVSFTCSIPIEKIFNLELAELISKLNQTTYVSSIYFIKNEENITVYAKSIFQNVFPNSHFQEFWSMFLADQALLKEIE